MLRMDNIKNQHPECSSVCSHNNEWLQQIFEVDNLENVLWKSKHSVKCKFCSDCSLSKENLINYIAIHNKIRASGLYNFQDCRIPVFSRLNIWYIRQKLLTTRFVTSLSMDGRWDIMKVRLDLVLVEIIREPHIFQNKLLVIW